MQEAEEGYTFVSKWGSYGTGDGEFYSPIGIAVDNSDNVYVSERGNDRIQKFDSVGNFIAKWGSEGDEDGQFFGPHGIAVDNSDNVYVADGNNWRVQKFDSNGNFIIKWGSWGTGDGQFTPTLGIAVDNSDNVYVSDTHDRIQKFDSVGNFITRWGSRGYGDGQFLEPKDIAVDSGSNVYVVDRDNDRIQKFDSDGNFITKWGKEGIGDGEFNYPHDIAVDSSGNVYVADLCNHRIQKFTPGIPPEPGQPNVVITGISASPDPVSPGDTVTITVDTRNDGTAGSADVVVTVEKTLSDYYCTLKWQRYSFGEGESHTLTYNYTVPHDAELGSYDVVAGACDDCTGTCPGQCCLVGLCSGPHTDGLKVDGVFEVVSDDAVPQIVSVEILDVNNIPTNIFTPGDTVKVRATISNPSQNRDYSVSVSMNIDEDTDGNNGAIYESHLTGEDWDTDLHTGEQDAHTWSWVVPSQTEAEKTYHVAVGIHDQSNYYDICYDCPGYGWDFDALVLVTDLGIQPGSFEFLTPRLQGDAIIFSIKVGIVNYGTTQQSALVKFFNGDPESGEQINGDIHLSIAPSTGREAEVDWSVEQEEGVYDIYVVVEPEGYVVDINEGNNQDTKSTTIAFNYIEGFPCYSQIDFENFFFKGLCGPSASACVLGYWDDHGYQGSSEFEDLVDYGDSSDGCKNCLVMELIIAQRCEQDPKGTQYWLAVLGLEVVCNVLNNYCFDARGLIWGELWQALKDEIDAGRPVIYYNANHYAPIFGYLEEGSNKRLLFCAPTGTKGLQTWDESMDLIVLTPGHCGNRGLILATCPVDLSVTDPTGFIITKSDEITGATYTETDINGDGDPDDSIIIFDLKIGDYRLSLK